jgi:Tol biopolymer transport system component
MIFLLAETMTASCSKKTAAIVRLLDTTTINQPALSGRLIFHNYSCYACNDSKLYQYDFATRQLTTISNGWNITNPMNAHFSPDGKIVVLMGIAANSNNWDIFLWRTSTSSQPTNLTAKFGITRDEDPKFSTDGNRIVFKQDGIIKEMDTLGNIIRKFAVTQKEGSMPYYLRGYSALLYSGSEANGTTADIFKFSISDNSIQSLSALPGLEEYYPIVRDDTSFLFTRWMSTSNQNDQVYKGFLNGRTFLRLPFNESDQNYSHAFPVESKYVICSSTRSGGKGG